ncbi:threonyl-tRNA synthetase editing domain-containing protein [Nocardia alni]|uniref:threonyl-tRNA synthetase editing domain-containing protein n=1 Tax=Nocardia alni TaxID=2815723 RepID=UPI001C23F941|nr:threonyl-tRNA synthetase editing domain-containing protein [Nocardia alni]
MRILSQRCRTFTYTVTTAGPCAVPLDVAILGIPHPFTDCLVLHIGVEKGDDARVGDAVKSVRRIIAKTAATDAVINGFSHLADPAQRGDVPMAMGVLDALTERLADKGTRVHLMPFGWNKRWSAEILDGEWEQRMVHLPHRAPALADAVFTGPGTLSSLS